MLSQMQLLIVVVKIIAKSTHSYLAVHRLQQDLQ